jgi:UDP:flavonoid glycosyltransferase YjiC (YdhE family)
LSLGISAELCGIPHVALSNAHWSPNANLGIPVPEHPLVRLLGVFAMRQILRVALPLFFRVQMKAFNRLRKAYGLGLLRGRGAQEVFTRGTRTAYLDVPELYDIDRLSDSEVFIGPVNWIPEMPLPSWWEDLPEDRPVVFVTAGSSGDAEATQRIVEGLVSRGWAVMVATAGRFDGASLPEGVFAADFIPAPAAADRADVVVFNGGSGMLYHALAHGTPVLGIPVNADQHYSMEAIRRKGAGEAIRAGYADPINVGEAVETILADTSYTEAARRMGKHVQALDPAARLSALMDALVSERRESAPWHSFAEATERKRAGLQMPVDEVAATA